MTPNEEENIYGEIDPWDLFASSLALGIVSGISWEELWFAISLANDGDEFDMAIWSTCELKSIVEDHYR